MVRLSPVRLMSAVDVRAIYALRVVTGTDVTPPVALLRLVLCSWSSAVVRQLGCSVGCSPSRRWPRYRELEPLTHGMAAAVTWAALVIASLRFARLACLGCGQAMPVDHDSGVLRTEG